MRKAAKGQNGAFGRSAIFAGRPDELLYDVFRRGRRDGPGR